LLILQEKQLERVLKAYVVYFNQARPQEAHPATDPPTAPIGSLCSGCRQEGDRSSDHGWFTPRLPLGGLKRNHM
jgi:hypothetical protein